MVVGNPPNHCLLQGGERRKCCYNRAMKKVLITLIAVLICSWSVNAAQGQAGAYYDAVVPVPDRSDKARREGIREGMARVLVRVTGDSQVVARPSVDSLLADASSYLLQFSYVEEERPGANSELGLRLVFDQGGIDRFLRANRLPIWPGNRPTLLVWAVVDSPLADSRFIGEGALDDVYTLLNQGFALRGMPIVSPLYDLQDELALPVSAARDFDVQQIDDASKRYPAQGWLMLRLYQKSDMAWRAAWLQSGGNAPFIQQAEGSELPELLGQVVDNVVDRIAADRVYVPRSESGQLLLVVSGIDRYKHYNALTELLSDNVMVQSYRVLSVTGDRVRLALTVEGETNQVIENLEQDVHFSAAESEVGTSNPVLEERPEPTFFKLSWRSQD